MEWRNAEWYWVISALLPLGGQQHSSVCFSVAGNTRDRKCTYKGFTWLRHKCSRAAGEMQNYLIDGLYNFQCLSVQLRGRNCFTTSKETLRLHMGGKVWWGLRRRWSSQILPEVKESTPRSLRRAILPQNCPCFPHSFTMETNQQHTMTPGRKSALLVGTSRDQALKQCLFC